MHPLWRNDRFVDEAGLKTSCLPDENSSNLQTEEKQWAVSKNVGNRCNWQIRRWNEGFNYRRPTSFKNTTIKFKKRITAITLMKQASTNKWTVNKTWSYSLCRSTDNAAPNVKNKPQTRRKKTKKKSMRYFVLVKNEQLILCDCVPLMQIKVKATHKIRWQ
jgi:hypothetical protein